MAANYTSRCLSKEFGVQLLGSQRLPIALLCHVALGFSISLWAADKPEEVVAKHLDAIGSAEARKNMKSRVVQGGSTYRVLVGGTGAIDGKFVFASEGQKSNFLFKINAGGFHGEQFICDGAKIRSPVRTRMSRSSLVTSFLLKTWYSAKICWRHMVDRVATA